MSEKTYEIIRLAINSLPLEKARIMKSVLKIVEEWDHPSFLTAALTAELVELKIDVTRRKREIIAMSEETKHLDEIIKDRNGTINELKLELGRAQTIIRELRG